jgi:hypothetical protein
MRWRYLFVRVPPLEELMRKLIMTATAGLLLTFSAASVDAAAANLIEGRAVYQSPRSHWRGNDFGPGFESHQPVPNKAMRMRMAPAPGIGTT